MRETTKKGKIRFEDLMRELAAMEQQLLPENSSLAMSLMVLEAKIRERFQQMEYRLIEKDPDYFSHLDEIDGEISFADFQHLIPQDLFVPSILDEIQTPKPAGKKIRTVGMAALLAVSTALGVFGLASLLHMVLTWVA